jgi:hypothetical protein
LGKPHDSDSNSIWKIADFSVRFQWWFKEENLEPSIPKKTLEPHKMEFIMKWSFAFEIWWSLIQNIWVKEFPKYVQGLVYHPPNQKKNEKTLNHGEGP